MENLSREVSIARQSGIKIALEFCKIHGIEPSLKELFRLTDIMAQDALMLSNKEFTQQVKKVDQWVVDKKKNLVEPK